MRRDKTSNFRFVNGPRNAHNKCSICMMNAPSFERLCLRRARCSYWQQTRVIVCFEDAASIMADGSIFAIKPSWQSGYDFKNASLVVWVVLRHGGPSSANLTL